MAVTIPLRALIPYALGALEYLLRDLLEPAPQTQPVSQPFTPPFSGGQCDDTVYDFTYTRTTIQSPFEASGTVVNEDRLDIGNTVTGAITGIEIGVFANSSNFRVFHKGGVKEAASGGGKYAYSSNFGITEYSFTNIQFIPRSGQPNNCGDLPNPNPPTPVSGSGLADSGSPNLDNSEVVQAGVPFIALPSFLAALNAALNAARAASDALSAIKSIADAIAAVANLLDKLLDKINEEEKEEEEENKEISRYDFGSISKDGYLRLYPSSSTKKRAIYLDLQILSIPIYYGKYFGKKSPDFYRFKSLGYISFVSPTFGIMEVKDIEFGRMSLNIPENATGFFYHLGLEGDIFANASAFYLESK